MATALVLLGGVVAVVLLVVRSAPPEDRPRRPVDDAEVLERVLPRAARGVGAAPDAGVEAEAARDPSGVPGGDGGARTGGLADGAVTERDDGLGRPASLDGGARPDAPGPAPERAP